MAVKIRLTRKGKKKQPTYRVVVADSRAPRDGRYIEQIGRYDPRQEPSVVVIDNDRAAYWLSQGAQPSDAVRKLLEISGAIDARPVKIKDPKVHLVDEAAQAEDAQDDAEIEAAAAAVAETVADEATDDDESFFDKVKDAVEDAAEAVSDFVEDTVEKITGDDDDDGAGDDAADEESE
jgi:small subunit ribosomal protein S16